MKGSIHFRKDTGWWFVLWYEKLKGRGIQVARYKGERMYDRRLAHKLLSIMQADQEAGTFRIEKYLDASWTDVVPYLDEWLKAVSPTLTPATVKDYSNSIRNYLKPFFMKYQCQLHEIRYDTLVKLLNEIDRGGKGKLNVMYCLHACLQFAWRSRRIPELPPFPERRLYSIKEPSIQWVTEDRQMAIIQAIPEGHRPIFLWLKYHLRRPAEACAMRKEDYLPEHDAFIIRRSISARQDIDRTKTNVEHVIPCHSEFKALAIERSKGFGGYFFVNPLARKNGKRYTNESLNNLWKAACKVAGESISLYAGLKHSSCSQFINEKGLSISDLQDITDHSRIDSVRKYAKMDVARKRELMETRTIVSIAELLRNKKDAL